MRTLTKVGRRLVVKLDGKPHCEADSVALLCDACAAVASKAPAPAAAVRTRYVPRTKLEALRMRRRAFKAPTRAREEDDVVKRLSCGHFVDVMPSKSGGAFVFPVRVPDVPGLAERIAAAAAAKGESERERDARVAAFLRGGGAA